MSSSGSLTIFTGTKAQFLKMVPIIIEFEKRGWAYRIIDTGQHAQLVRHIIEQFNLRNPDISLDPGGKGVSSLGEGLFWMVRLLKIVFTSKTKLINDLFGTPNGICFIHGDTMSTLLSCLIAKRAGQRVAHVEAGLRSYNYLHPFPEEIVRVVVMRLADYLFAPSQIASENLRKMGLSTKSYLLDGNTNLDTMAITLNTHVKDLPEVPKNYSVVTIHRLETIFSKKQMNVVLDTIIKAHLRCSVIFIQHPPTIKRLRSYGMDQVLLAAGVSLSPLLDHASFLHLLTKANFVITDGGSIQEEASYLGVPCLLLRKTTERDEGLDENVVLSKMDERRILDFLDNPEKYRRENRSQTFESPSKNIADIVAKVI